VAVRLALIGAGRMGSTHARALGARLAAVVEPSDDAAARSGIGRRYRELGELLEDGEVDGALVAAPTRLHAAIVERLLEARVPVLCEKPCGLSSDTTRALAARAAQAGVPLHVGYWRRFVPALCALRERIAAGELGELAYVACAQWDQRPPPAAFRDPRSSGGILVDMGVHELDQLRWLTGQEPVAFAGVATSVAFDPPVAGDPEGVVLSVSLDGGTAATVSLLRRHPPGDLCRIEVVGTRAATRLDFLPPDAGEAPLLDALRAQADDFAAAIRGEPSRGATAADAVAALTAAERARAALGL
jgi:myo-inositol 2-dehydrogenase / D-chiro-inositol 1-dehydrogenase